MVLNSVKGGLVVTSYLGNEYAEMVYYNTSEFAHKRHDPNPTFSDIKSQVIQEGELKHSYGLNTNAVNEVRFS